MIGCEARRGSVDCVTLSWAGCSHGTAPLSVHCRQSQSRGREREEGRDTAMREGSPLTAPLAHWADAGVTEFDYREI